MFMELLVVLELSMMMRDDDVELTPLLIQDERYNDLFRSIALR